MSFSPDSKHVAYWAAPFSGKWHLFVDGQHTEGFDERLYIRPPATNAGVVQG